MLSLFLSIQVTKFPSKKEHIKTKKNKKDKNQFKYGINNLIFQLIFDIVLCLLIEISSPLVNL